MADEWRPAQMQIVQSEDYLQLFYNTRQRTAAIEELEVGHLKILGPNRTS